MSTQSSEGSNTLLIELHALQDRLTGLSRYERIILDLAAVLAEDLVEIQTGSLPKRVTTMSVNDYEENRLPELWEYEDGRPTPKHWKARAEGGW